MQGSQEEQEPKTPSLLSALTALFGRQRKETIRDIWTSEMEYQQQQDELLLIVDKGDDDHHRLICKAASDRCKREAKKYRYIYMLLIFTSSFLSATAGTLGTLLKNDAFGVTMGLLAAFLGVSVVLIRAGERSESYATLALDFKLMEHEPYSKTKYDILCRRSEIAALNLELLTVED